MNLIICYEFGGGGDLRELGGILGKHGTLNGRPLGSKELNSHTLHLKSGGDCDQFNSLGQHSLGGGGFSYLCKHYFLSYVPHS